MSTLEFVNVTKIYNVRGAGTLKALDDVSFTLSSGQTIGLVGQSGSGKSTIAKILTQLERATSGEVLLDGSPIPRRGRELRAYRQQLRMVFQDPFASLNPYHSIRYHIERPLRLHNVVPKAETDAEVRRLLERVRLDPKTVIDRRPHELSGGERGRLHLAKLLQTGGNVLLLDEPTNDLDIETLRALENALLEFPGCAMVISHDRWFLDRIATHILDYQDEGKIEFFEGNFTEYEEWKKKTYGAEAVQPHRAKYKRIAK